MARRLQRSLFLAAQLLAAVLVLSTVAAGCRCPRERECSGSRASASFYIGPACDDRWHWPYAQWTTDDCGWRAAC